MTKQQKFFSALGRFFKDVFTKNIGLKITAFLFAVLLWGYVLGIENPSYVKRVRDVEVTFTGEDSLNTRGLMLVSREKILNDVDVECELSKHSDLDESRVTCTVDLSDRNITLDRDEDSTTITLPVQTKVASGYGSVQSVSVSAVELTVARISSRNNIQVDIETQNSLPEGYVCNLPEKLTVSLRGQKSKLDRIARASVTVDLSSLRSSGDSSIAGTYELVLPVRFKDEANNVLDDIVTSSGETVTASVSIVIRAYKDVPIVPDVIATDSFEEIYQYECIPAQSEIRIFGDPAVIAPIESIKTEPILCEEKIGEERITVSLVIPDGVIFDAAQSDMITVLLRVSEQMADVEEIEIPITYSYPRAGVVLDGTEAKTLLVRVSGTVNAMKSFNTSWIKLNVDLSNYDEGVYELPVRLDFTGDTELYTVTLVSNSVRVVLKSVVEDEPTEG